MSTSQQELLDNVHSAIIAAPSSTYRCEIVTDFSKLEELWLQLRGEPSDCRTGIFQQPNWVRAFWRAYSSKLWVYSPVVYRNETVVGILPLVCRGDAIGFLGSPDSDYNDFLCDEPSATAALELALSSLLHSPFDWERCILDNVPSSSKLFQHVPVLSSRLRKHLQFVFQNPAPTILLNENKGELLSQLCDKNQLRRYYNKLRKMGSLTFRHIETQEEALKHLDIFFEQHITRWAMSGRRSQFLHPDARDFYQGLIEELDLRAELRFGVLELDSRPIAYHLGFQVNGTFVWYKPAFDIHYWDHCPGDVLLRSLLQYASEADIREFDFSVGDESFKYRFANHVKENYALYFERHPARLKSRLKIIARRGTQVIRRRPRLKKAAKWVLRSYKAAISSVSNVRLRGLGMRCIKTLTATYDGISLLSSGRQSFKNVFDLEIVPGNLISLAHIFVRYPDFLNEHKLRECRLWLKAGDRMLLAWRGDDVVAVFWLRVDYATPLNETGPEFKLPFNAPRSILYEAWAPPSFDAADIPSDAFGALAEYCEDVWICCSHRQKRLLRLLEDAGFQLRDRLKHHRLLNFFQQTTRS